MQLVSVGLGEPYGTDSYSPGTKVYGAFLAEFGLSLRALACEERSPVYLNCQEACDGRERSACAQTRCYFEVDQHQKKLD
jgi:hypothetical protein